MLNWSFESKIRLKMQSRDGHEDRVCPYKLILSLTLYFRSFIGRLVVFKELVMILFTDIHSDPLQMIRLICVLKIIHIGAQISAAETR